MIFWKVWRSKFGKSRIVPKVIDGDANDLVIVNKFAKYFSETCSVNLTEKNVNMMLSFKQQFANYIGDTENIKYKKI